MNKFLKKVFHRPTAQEQAANELHLAQLDALAAAAAMLEYWQAKKAMLEGRVRRLTNVLGQS